MVNERANVILTAHTHSTMLHGVQRTPTIENGYISAPLGLILKVSLMGCRDRPTEREPLHQCSPPRTLSPRSRSPTERGSEAKSSYTVLGVKISHGHDHTSCATLGHFEVEFRCGTCTYDTQAQCSAQSLIVGAAHFGARMLKVRPTGEGGTPKRLKIWLFQGANVDEMH